MRYPPARPPIIRPPDGTFAWRREPASDADLTPVGRMLFASGARPMSGRRLVPTFLLTAFYLLVTLFMLAVAALTVAGVTMASRSELIPAILCAGIFVGLTLAGARTVRATVRDAGRLGTWTAPTGLAWRNGIWVDAVRETLSNRRRPVVVRRLVRWIADCPVCAAPVQLVEGDQRGRTPPAAFCSEHPGHHRCTFDRATLMGEWWDDGAHLDQPFT